MRGVEFLIEPLVVKKYDSLEEREQLLKEFEAQGFRLVEESNIMEGNFLTLTSEPYVEELTKEEQLQQQVADLQALINAMLGVDE